MASPQPSDCEADFASKLNQYAEWWFALAQTKGWFFGDIASTAIGRSMSPFRPEFSRARLAQGLDEAAVDQLAGQARVRRFATGARIFNQGDTDARAHIVLSGAVRITQSGPDGGHVLLRFIPAGELFGALAIFHNRRYPGDATAAVDTVEASWAEAELLQLIQAWPQLSLNLIRIVGERLQEAQDRVRELSTQRAEQRIANTLLRLARQAGVKTCEGISISTPLRRLDVAELSGTTLYTASRILTGWAKEGLVETTRLQVALRRPEKLEALARASR